MKRLSLILFATLLVGCSALQSAPPTPQPTPVPPTAQVIVATVLVPVVETVIHTQEVPTSLPTVVLPTQAALPTVAASPTSSAGPFTVDDNLGNGYFKNITYSTDAFSLRCLTKSVTFNVTAAESHIFSVELFYRIRDKNSTDISPWVNAGVMLNDLKGNYSFTLKAEWISEDWRRTQTWLDFEFVGVNKLGDVVGRTEKFIGLINYSNDCP